MLLEPDRIGIHHVTVVDNISKRPWLCWMFPRLHRDILYTDNIPPVLNCQMWVHNYAQWSINTFQIREIGKDCVVEGSAKCQTIQTIFKPNHQNGMKTMMYDVSQVVSYSGMMKGKGILLRYNCPSLHITFNIILGPIYLNLDLGLINWFIKHDSSPFQAWIELNGSLADPCWTILGNNDLIKIIKSLITILFTTKGFS